jgi:hypothetical protein
MLTDEQSANLGEPMRAIVSLMLSFYFLTFVLTVIAYREVDLQVGLFAIVMFTVASGLLWHLTRKFRAKGRGLMMSVWLVLLSLFIPMDG